MKTLKQLQRQERKLWEALEEIGSSNCDLVKELIEVSLEIEESCNK